MKFAFLLLLVSCFLLLIVNIAFSIDDHSSLSSSSTAAGADGIGTCPALSAFPFWLRRQCPPFEDTRCATAFPSDVPAPPGQLSCSLASAQPNARLRQLSARELLAFAKRRDPFGRPVCMLTLFYAPDCVFSAKVADTFFRVAPLLPKLHVVAVDVSVGGKGTESLISHYGISSTPVIALWQDGFPRYRLYDDYARLDTLLRVLRTHTDLTPTAAVGDSNSSSPSPYHGTVGQQQAKMLPREHQQQQQTNEKEDGEKSVVIVDGSGGDKSVQNETTQQQQNDGGGEDGGGGATTTAMPSEEAKGGGSSSNGRGQQQTLPHQQKQQQKHQWQQQHSPLPWWEPSREEFLAQFHYLKEHLGFDWYLFAAVVTCLVNCVYFVVSSNKGRALLRRHFPQHFAAAAVVVLH
ncbi:hypothetical protein niasHT_037273 [Heterodera trifolii]|uniref:Thioredoxin domain-containing protein n=1 Tax=Heterodera trifolii TaxID=157864 RepID=A0ABD2IVL7_9BILA